MITYSEMKSRYEVKLVDIPIPRSAEFIHAMKYRFQLFFYFVI